MRNSIELILSLLAVTSLAVPAPDARPSLKAAETFTLAAVHNENNVPRDGTTELLRAYAKFGLTPEKHAPSWFTEALKTSLVKRQDGTAVTTPNNGVNWVVQATIGGQSLKIMLDTGSSDFWVRSSLLPAASQKGHVIFSPNKSTTYKELSGYSWDIKYFDGSGASGVVGTETVSIGGTTVKAQAIQLASKLSSDFLTTNYDGVVGLGFSSFNSIQPKSQKTFFENAMSSLSQPLFAAYLPEMKPGAYNFGFIDSTKYTGAMTYVDVQNDQGFWAFPSTGYKVGAKVYTQTGTVTGVVDTGTSLLLVSADVAKNYYAAVPKASFDSGSGGYTFPCSSSLPSLSVKIGTAYATIPGSFLNYENLGSGKCFGGLQSAGVGDEQIYGGPFLNAFYTVYDYRGPKFGYAPVVQ